MEEYYLINEGLVVLRVGFDWNSTCLFELDLGDFGLYKGSIEVD